MGVVVKRVNHSKMNAEILKIINQLEKNQSINAERKSSLQPFIDFVQRKVNKSQQIDITFICTHNSRRSHLAQLWAQVAANYYNIPSVNCYSGGSEVTAIFPKIIDTLLDQGFEILKIGACQNPIYAIKYSENMQPIIAFSKQYDNRFNPVSAFLAILTCNQADGDCPYIAGAELRVPITYEDPKISDDTPHQTIIYAARSLEIATEMLYVFSNIKLN